MKRFLYFKTKIYRSKEYLNYLNSLEEDKEDIDETELWKDSLSDETPKTPPKPYISRIAIDPDLIISFAESHSLEEMARNKENPKFDCIDIMLMDGRDVTIIGTLEEFENQLLALNR